MYTRPFSDKADATREIIAKKKLDSAKVMYVGNDTNDSEAMALVGHAVAPADSHPEIIEVAKTVTKARGGQVVRELADLLLSRSYPREIEDKKRTNNLKGYSNKAIIREPFAQRSPIAHVTQGSPVPAKASEKKIAVSITDPNKDDAVGAFHQAFSRRRSKTLISISCATKNALPDATAVLTMAKASGSSMSASQMESPVPWLTPDAITKALKNSQSYPESKTDRHNASGRANTKDPVGRIGYQKCDWIGKGSPRQNCRKIDSKYHSLNRMLHKFIRRQDHRAHRGNGKKQISCGVLFIQELTPI